MLGCSIDRGDSRVTCVVLCELLRERLRLNLLARHHFWLRSRFYFSNCRILSFKDLEREEHPMCERCNSEFFFLNDCNSAIRFTSTTCFSSTYSCKLWQSACSLSVRYSSLGDFIGVGIDNNGLLLEKRLLSVSIKVRLELD